MDLKFVEFLSANPTNFNNAFTWKFRIESSLPEPVPLTLAFVWVGSAKSSEHDIILDEIDLEGIQPGLNEFTIDHQAPDVTQIPEDELFGMTVLTISFSITGESSFNRLAYLVDVGAFGELSDSIRSGNSQPPIINQENPEQRRQALLSVLGRNVVADRPRLSVFPTDVWHGWRWDDDQGRWVKDGNQQQMMLQADGAGGASNNSNSQQGGGGSTNFNSYGTTNNALAGDTEVSED